MASYQSSYKDLTMNQNMNASASEIAAKAPYDQPSLTHFGSVKELTAGGSKGLREATGGSDPSKKPF